MILRKFRENYGYAMRRMLILLFIGCWNSMLLAQLPTLLTLEECIRRSEQHSFRLLSDDNEIAVAENTASIAESRSIPHISGELATDHRFLRPYYF